VLRDETVMRYDWSFFLAWISVGLSLISSILFFSAAACLHTERETEKMKNVQYIMPGLQYCRICYISEGQKHDGTLEHLPYSHIEHSICGKQSA